MKEEKIFSQTDSLRQLIDLAVESGRKRQSEQTGYVHYYYPQDEGISLPIPTYENALFALALFRTRTVENATEAKSLLEKLLHFQDRESGNFPLYLHEYPQCKDRFLSAHLLPALYGIFKLFSHILATDLRSRLEKALKSLVEYSLRAHQEKPAPYPVAVKIAAASKAIGSLCHWPSVEQKGDQLLASLANDSTHWWISSHLADILVALQMISPSIPWMNFRHHLNATWHQEIYHYAGPAIRELQQGFEPKPGLYDLFLGYRCGSFSIRALQSHPYHLQAALIQPFEDSQPQKVYPMQLQGKIQESRWIMHQEEKYALSVIEAPPSDKNFHCFRLLWGNQKVTHSLVCQGGNVAAISSHLSPDHVEFTFTLKETFQLEEREKSRELAFYFDIQEETKIVVAGHPSTTFQLNEKVLIRSPLLAFELAFSLEEGEGQFLGHIMMGNRPSQLSISGENRFQAYDWQIFLRTIQRTSLCRISVSLKIVDEGTCAS